MWRLRSKLLHLPLWIGLFALASAFEFACFSSNCPSISPCMGASHEGLRVIVDLRQIEDDLVDSAFVLRIDSVGQDPKLFACTLGEGCKDSYASAPADSTLGYSEDLLPDSANLRFLDEKTLQVDLVRSRGFRRMWGPEQSTLKISSGALVRKVDLTPNYRTFQQTECFYCKIASEKWIPEPATNPQ